MNKNNNISHKTIQSKLLTENQSSKSSSSSSVDLISSSSSLELEIFIEVAMMRGGARAKTEFFVDEKFKFYLTNLLSKAQGHPKSQTFALTILLP